MKRDRARLLEILSVLRRHGAARGMTPEKFRSIAEELGPTYVKIGQILSTRPDLLPEAYCEELEKLRARATPFSGADARRIIEGELGAPLGAVFAAFTDEPLGSASIAQVHPAVLTDGTPVVVKVQRPDVLETMQRDVALLMRAARLLDRTGVAGGTVDFQRLLKEIWRITQQEIDFKAEADNMRVFTRLNKNVPYAACPRVMPELTTRRVLVMERVNGVPIDDLEALCAAGQEPRALAQRLAQHYAKQVLDDRFFHADPHAGNLIVREGQIVWLDLGMVGKLSERDGALLSKATLAFVQGDVAAVKAVLLAFGAPAGRVDQVQLYADVDDLLARYGSMPVKDMDIGEMMTALMRVAGAHGLRMPDSLVLLGRSSILIQNLLARLAPEISLLAVLSQHSAGAPRAGQIAEAAQESAKSLLTSGRKALNLPSQMSDLLQAAARGQAKLNLEFTGSQEPLRRVDQMVNKLVLALLIAALLISAGLLSALAGTPTLQTLGGLGFVAAAALAARLWWIVRKR